MKELVVLILLFLVLSCGKEGDYSPQCRPQSIAIAECQKEEWEREPNRFLIEFQKERCQQRFPFNICYDY